MICKLPMVELVDPSGKAIELYTRADEMDGDFFATMQTSKAEDKILIQDAIRKLFTRGASYLDIGRPEDNFN